MTTPQEPTTLEELFRITPATGTLTHLEHVKVKDKDVGRATPVAPGVKAQPYILYVEGAASAVTFKYGEPQVFAIRLMGSDGRKSLVIGQRIQEYPWEATPAEVPKHFALTQLNVQDGKRIVPETDVPLDVQSYGKPSLGMDGRKPDGVAVSFQLTPHTALPPGQYLVTYIPERADVIAAWMSLPFRPPGSTDLNQHFPFHKAATFFKGSHHWAFGILER